MEDVVTTAKIFAKSKHASIIWQTVIGDRPQSDHLQEVADKVEETGGTEIEIAAAWLHDVVEDTNTTFQEIRSICGEKVAYIVEELTDTDEIKHLATTERKAKQAERIMNESDSAKRIKLADQISNVRFVTEYPKVQWTLDGRRSYVKGAKQIADACKGINPTLDELFEKEYRNAINKLGT